MDLIANENHWYVNFDGESYLMTAPLMSMIQDIKDAAQAGTITLPDGLVGQDGQIRDFYCIQEKPDRVEIGISSACDKPMVYYSTKTKKYQTAELKDPEYWPVPMRKYWPSTTYFPVHPMLIPLNPDGFLDLQAVGFAQNGMLTKGGTVYTSDYPNGEALLFTPGTDPKYIGALQTQIRICNSSNEEKDNLTWMCWNGCLILCDDIVRTGMEGFWHSKIPWPSQELIQISEYQQALQQLGIDK